MEKAAVEKLYTELGMKYEATYGKDVGLQKMVRMWLEMLPSDAPVFDCGCGTGKPVAKMIVDSGRQVHGIDLTPSMVSLCRQQVPSGSFEVANMLEFRPTQEYDGIIASLSLFELNRQDLTSMPTRWFKWMKPGGLLLIATVAAEDVEKQVKEKQVEAKAFDRDGEFARVEWKFMDKDVLISLYTKAGWKVILEDAGFEIFDDRSDLFVPAGSVGVDEARYYIIAKKPSGAC